MPTLRAIREEEKRRREAEADAFDSVDRGEGSTPRLHDDRLESEHEQELNSEEQVQRDLLLHASLESDHEHASVPGSEQGESLDGAFFFVSRCMRSVY